MCFVALVYVRLHEILALHWLDVVFVGSVLVPYEHFVRAVALRFGLRNAYVFLRSSGRQVRTTIG